MTNKKFYVHTFNSESDRYAAVTNIHNLTTGKDGRITGMYTKQQAIKYATDYVTKSGREPQAAGRIEYFIQN